MKVREMFSNKLLAGTALTTTLLLAAGNLPAAADANIPLGGYSGPIQLNFNNFESFLTPGGNVTSTPHVGDQNFGIFSVLSITGNQSPVPLWVPGQNGQVLVGVFNDINITSVNAANISAVKTFNTGGVFKLYLVNTTQFVAAGGDQGLAGYANAGCAIGSLCYNGITNEASSQLALTLDLIPGISAVDANATLTATVDETLNPPTGNAAFHGNITSPQFLPFASGKDSFCPNNSALCPGHDNSSFALASQDPIIATVVPEPSSLLLFGGGLLGLGSLLARRRRKRKRDGVVA